MKPRHPYGGLFAQYQELITLKWDSDETCELGPVQSTDEKILAYLRERGVEVQVVNNDDCVHMMRDFILRNPLLWNEDIGER